MSEHAVVIAGGGPTGLMLAGELPLAGVDVIIVERRASEDVDGSRAGGLHFHTIEVLDQNAIADRFLAEGQESVRGLPEPFWTSATSPPATTTSCRCGRAYSSPSWPAGSVSSGCRCWDTKNGATPLLEPFDDAGYGRRLWSPRVSQAIGEPPSIARASVGSSYYLAR